METVAGALGDDPLAQSSRSTSHGRDGRACLRTMTKKPAGKSSTGQDGAGSESQDPSIIQPGRVPAFCASQKAAPTPRAVEPTGMGI